MTQWCAADGLQVCHGIYEWGIGDLRSPASSEVCLLNSFFKKEWWIFFYHSDFRSMQPVCLYSMFIVLQKTGTSLSIQIWIPQQKGIQCHCLITCRIFWLAKSFFVFLDFFGWAKYILMRNVHLISHQCLKEFKSSLLPDDTFLICLVSIGGNFPASASLSYELIYTVCFPSDF